MNPWIVAKFGGSSVKDGSAMLHCSQIVESNPEIRVVVISATQNTTNQLEYVAQAALRGDKETLNKVINEITEKHLNIAKDIYASTSVIADLENLFNELKLVADRVLKDSSYTPMIMDHLYSLGERMSSLLFSDLLRLRMAPKKIHLIDARKVIKTDSNFQKAEPQIELISSIAMRDLLPLLNQENTILVTQGFIGEDLQKNTTTLGREGSDYSAALLGEALDVSAIQIWTDVQGIASSDPRIIPDVHYISRLSYDEATSLATLGAKVLFPTTLKPAQRKLIPVYVGSSINAELPMTIIENKMQDNFSLKAVTIQRVGESLVLSLVGSHLSLLPNFKEELLNKLNSNESHFIFHQMTNLSISLTVTDLDAQTALKLGHAVLKTFQ
jgi:aspartate kinase